MYKISTTIRNKIVFQLFFILTFTILFLLDDYIFKLFNDINKTVLSFEYFMLAFALATSISFIRNKKLIYIILAFLFFIETCSMVYLSYFGTHMHPTIIPLIFKEVVEIQETGFSSMGVVYYAFLSTIIPYGIMIFLVKKYHDRLFNFKFAWIIFIVLMSILPIRAIKTSNIVRMLANPKYPSIYNSLRIYSGYYFNILPRAAKSRDYDFKDYEVSKISALNDKMNIVLVYGESFNYYNQGLYGYEKETTPNLSKMAKQDKNFAYKKGIACAIATQQSIPSFFNLQREPQNYRMQINMKLNLFKLAKEQGFKTFLISAQNTGLLNNIGSQYVDVFITREDADELFEKHRDEALLKIIKEQNLSDKNFIVLHQRNLHSPYEKNYSHRKNKFEKFESSYDNAMLYNDYVLNEIIDYFRQLENPLYLFITSDHNELTGQNGLYGHARLMPEYAEVPIMLYTKDQKILNKFKNIFAPTHYEIGLMIANILGYSIKNPNEINNVYYINGNDAMGRYGYIEVIKDTDSINYRIIDVDKI